MKKIKNFLIMLICNFIALMPMVYAIGVNGVPADDPLNEALKDIVGTLLWVACIVCVGKAIHIGILFVLQGSGGKAIAKSALLPWLIGVAVCAGFAVIGPAIMDLFYNGDPVLGQP